jgi:hypothetical protein
MEGVKNELHAVRNAGRGVNQPKVFPDGLFSDAELMCNLPVMPTVHDTVNDGVFLG